ncbi:MAG: tRNA (guanosine(37)-N1)-methyltransferase TrmD, partial [Bdellovibrionota bacterium]
SLGDYVLSGGELPSMCMMDSIARYIPGTLGNEDSAQLDSFEDGLLEAPCYTKPQIFHNEKIPSVLLSGDHKKIEQYKKNEQLKITAKMRPDLIYLLWEKLSRQEKFLVEKVWKEK